jgi:hypothetical protein
MRSGHDARPFHDFPLCDARRPRDDVWRLDHSVTLLVRDARESCTLPFGSPGLSRFSSTSYETSTQLRTNLLETMREDSISKDLVEKSASLAHARQPTWVLKQCLNARM